MDMMKKRLGDILLERGWVDGRQLNSALDHQRQRGVPLGQVLVDLHLCSPDHVLEALAHQTGVPALDLDSEPLNPMLARRMPRPLAERHRVVPLRMAGPNDSVLVVAIAAPASLQSLESVRHVMSQTQVEPRLATDRAISRALERLYAEVPLILLTERDIVEEERPVISCSCPGVAPTGTVLLHGWPAAAAVGMERALKLSGYPASVADRERVLAANESEVVVLPMSLLECMDERPRARLLVAGKGLSDRIKALTLGADGFLMAPVEPEQLLHSLEQLVHTLQ